MKLEQQLHSQLRGSSELSSLQQDFPSSLSHSAGHLPDLKPLLASPEPIPLAVPQLRGPGVMAGATRCPLVWVGEEGAFLPPTSSSCIPLGSC